MFLSLSAVLLHEQNKSKFVPYLMCTMFAKHPKKNILYRSIESSARRTILENSFLQSFAKKKMADVWLTLSLDHAILLLIEIGNVEISKVF